MTRFLLYTLTGTTLFAVGLYALIAYTNLVRKILALNVMGSAIFLLLVAVAYRNRAAAPDAVPQAMVLTGIVVAVSATALALALARRIHAGSNATTLGEEDDAA